MLNEKIRALTRLPRILMAAALVMAGATAPRAQEPTEPRLALVIGNSSYAAIPGLDNPVNDAALIAAALEKAAFDVTLITDADQVALSRAISGFGRDLRAAGPDAAGLFFYAGHGVQSFGNNYLLPIDAALTDAADLPLVGVNAMAVLRQMNSARNAINIVILDACRDNPFDNVDMLTENGLAEMNAPTGTFLAYSTAPGAVALDGLDGNSPFTAALAGYVPEPGLAIEQLFKAVRIDVLRATNGRQVPWDTSSLTRDFAFVPDTAEREANALWQSVRGSDDPVQLLLFLRAHPESKRAPEARKILATLIAREAAGPQTAALDEQSRAAPQPAPAEPAPPPTAAPETPEFSERDMIETARKTGTLDDYQAYLDAYPEGVYAELAAFEIAILREKAATAAAAPPAPTAPVTPPAPAAAPAPPAEPSVVAFGAPLSVGDPVLDGKSLDDLISGSPLFPPIEGLPDEVWKGKSCSDCHAWQQTNLCDQGKTYLSANAERSLSKQHPYGGKFKATLRRWAEADCP